MKGRVNTGGGGGLNASVILVTAPTGSTVTCTKGGTTKTAVEKNGLWTFRGIENGEWTVKATKGGQSTSQPVNVTQFDVYRVTLAYFNATIVTTFPTDCTSVTCKKGATTLSVPSGSLSSGSYTFAIPEAGEWVLYATNGTKEKTVTVNVTEETAYTSALNFELYLFNAGDQCEDVTGGWDAIGYGGTTSKITTAIYVENDGPGYVYTNGKIDTTGYTKLCFNVISIKTYEGAYYRHFGLAKNYSSSPVASVRPTGNGVWIADISEINNAENVVVFVASDGCRATVDKVWLE